MLHCLFFTIAKSAYIRVCYLGGGGRNDSLVNVVGRVDILYQLLLIKTSVFNLVFQCCITAPLFVACVADVKSRVMMLLCFNYL